MIKHRLNFIRTPTKSYDLIHEFSVFIITPLKNFKFEFPIAVSIFWKADFI